MFGIMRSSGAGRNAARYPCIAFSDTNANELPHHLSRFERLSGGCAGILGQGAELYLPVISSGGGRILW